MIYTRVFLCLISVLVGLVIGLAVVLELESKEVDWFGTYKGSSLSVGDSYAVDQNTFNPQQAGKNE